MAAAGLAAAAGMAVVLVVTAKPAQRLTRWETSQVVEAAAWMAEAAAAAATGAAWAEVVSAHEVEGAEALPEEGAPAAAMAVVALRAETRVVAELEATAEGVEDSDMAAAAEAAGARAVGLEREAEETAMAVVAASAKVEVAASAAAAKEAVAAVAASEA